jgi:hypothetical protein
MPLRSTNAADGSWLPFDTAFGDIAIDSFNSHIQLTLILAHDAGLELGSSGLQLWTHVYVNHVDGPGTAETGTAPARPWIEPAG